MRSKKKLWAAAIAVLTAGSLAACSSTDSSPDSSSGSSSGSGEPVNLTYWTWAQGVPEAVDVWNKAHPDIKVTVEQPAGSDTILSKVLTAQRAGEGPDMFAAEYQTLPSFVAAEAAYDITDMIGDAKDAYTDNTWSLTTLGDTVYAIPQDIGPAVFLYRADLFEQYGYDVPATWDEYAALAAQVKQDHPDTYLGFYPDELQTFSAYVQQLGGNLWSVQDDAWKVDFTSAAAEKVASFWQPLVQNKLVDTTHYFTPEWSTMMNDGTLLSWVVGVWGPGTLQSVAPDTAGDWRIAPMPKWDDNSKTGIMGGSSAMVSATSKHPEQAVEFLTWLNTSDEATAILASQGGLFPASTTGQAQLDNVPVTDIVAGQADFWDIARAAANDTSAVTWGPNSSVGFDSYNDAITKAVANGTSFTDALAAVQSAVKDDLVSQGYSVVD